MPDSTAININCLSHWYPKLVARGLPVPRTEIVEIDEAAADDIWRALDGNELTEKSRPFFYRMVDAAKRLGYPCFMRTGQTSAKHGWRDTCYVAGPEQLRRHVVNIAEFSECAQIIGLDWSVWSLREMLPTTPVMVADRYGDMPLCREFRVFVSDGDIECWHPYWPKKATRDGLSTIPDDFYASYRRLTEATDVEQTQFQIIAAEAGRAVGGRWSVDILDTQRGWYVTDMAEADKSYHWPECAVRTRSQENAVIK